MTFTEAIELTKSESTKEQGFAYLYESTYNEKYYIALKYMKNEDDAADVLQDAYIKAFDNLDKLDNPEKFPSWFGTIVARTALNTLKKRKDVLFSDLSGENYDGDEYEYQLEDDAQDFQPEEAFSKKETATLVRELIDSLSDEQRMCILMFHIEGLSIREIAEALGCSDNTVKSRLNYGRKNIKQKAEELQKKGYKLYGFAPLPLLIWLLKAENSFLDFSNTAKREIYKKAVLHSVEKAVNEAAKTAAKKAASKTAKAAVKQSFFKTVAGKITAVVLSVVIIGGGVSGAMAVRNKANSTSSGNTEVSQSVGDESNNATTERVNKKTPSADEVIAALEGYVKSEGLENASGDNKYRVTDIDSDNIPELLMISGVEKTYIVFYNNGSPSSIENYGSGYAGFYYDIKNETIDAFTVSDGMSDDFTDDIYKIKNSSIKNNKNGKFDKENKIVLLDGNMYYTSYYETIEEALSKYKEVVSVNSGLKIDINKLVNIYTLYLNKTYYEGITESDSAQFDFYDIDDDGILELYFSNETDVGFTYFHLLCYNGGDVEELSWSQYLVTYDYSHNTLCSKEIDYEGTVYSGIYKIVNSKLKDVATGEKTLEDVGISNGVCRWNGKDVSKDEYDKKFSELFDSNSAQEFIANSKTLNDAVVNYNPKK